MSTLGLAFRLVWWAIRHPIKLLKLTGWCATILLVAALLYGAHR